MELSNKKKLAGVYCCAYACTNDPIAKKGGLCHKHYARTRRKNNPIESRYNQFKNNAKRRGKDFTVTFEEFKNFCTKNNYLTPGRRGQNATIDRRCNVHGYHIWNMQILSLTQNCQKGTGPSADCPF